jgi:hypothetical protein
MPISKIERFREALREHLRALPLYVPIFFLLGVNILALGFLLFIFLPIPLSVPPFILPAAVAIGYALWQFSKRQRS